jgi:NADH-quinone oxidoreductase subunit N
MNFADLFRVTLPETALEVAALLVLLVDLAFLRKAVIHVRLIAAALLGVLGCIVSVATIPFQAQGPLLTPSGDQMLLAVGGSTAVGQIGILALTMLTLFLLMDSSFTRNPGEFVAVTLMSATGGLLISGAQDLLVIFIGLELLSLGLYILTAFAKKSGRSAEAAMKYYLFGGMSAAFLLFGFSYLYGIAGSTNLHRVVLATYGSNGINATPLLDVALVMIAAGLGFKVAAAPFHLWAPDTYEGAPASAAAFIASVSKVASFALLISISTAVLHVFGDARVVRLAVVVENGRLPRMIGFGAPWSVAIATLAAASMVLGNLAALAQTSVRRLLAYSAIAHGGYILLAIAYFSRTPASANAVLYYILTYGLTIVGAFGAVAVVERASGNDRMESFVGLHRRSPVLAGILLVLFLSLAGIPPLVGFWAKFNLFAAVLGVSRGFSPFALVVIAVAMSAVSLYYYLQVLKRVFVVPALDDAQMAVNPVTLMVLALIAASVVALGCFPALLQNWMASFYAPM